MKVANFFYFFYGAVAGVKKKEEDDSRGWFHWPARRERAVARSFPLLPADAIAQVAGTVLHPRAGTVVASGSATASLVGLRIQARLGRIIDEDEELLELLLLLDVL